jgi:hypothetical protein
MIALPTTFVREVFDYLPFIKVLTSTVVITLNLWLIAQKTKYIKLRTRTS